MNRATDRHTSKPRATIIIDNFNYGRFLRNAIDGALEQTWSDTEVIVVDDGSTDGSREIIASYGDRIIAVLKANGGQGSAFNAGFALSSGDMVFFLDADDMLLPGAVERVMPLFQSCTVAKVQWYLHEVRDGELTGGLFPRYRLANGDVLPALLKNGPLSYASAPTSGNAFVRSWLEKIMPMPAEAFRLNADAFLFTLAPIFGEVVTIPEPLGFYRLTPDSISNTTTAAQSLEFWNALAKVMRAHLLTHLGIRGHLKRWRSINEQFRRWSAVQAAEVEVEEHMQPGERVALLRTNAGWKPGFRPHGVRSEIKMFDTSLGNRFYLDWIAALQVSGIDFLAIESTAFKANKDLRQLSTTLRQQHECLFESERIVLLRLAASRNGRQVNE